MDPGLLGLDAIDAIQIGATLVREAEPLLLELPLERWAIARGVVLVGVFEDRGVSGATALDRRPGLLAAPGCMADHHAGLLVATKRDRFRVRRWR